MVATALGARISSIFGSNGLLHFGYHVRIRLEGKGHLGVPQQVRDVSGTDTLGQQKGCGTVAKVVEPDRGEL